MEHMLCVQSMPELADSNSVLKEWIRCTCDELLVCLLPRKRWLLMNEIMACHTVLQITVTPMIKISRVAPALLEKGLSLFGLRAEVLRRTSRCIYCKQNCFILCVFYTVDFFDIFCIHCDRMAQEVLVLAIVNVCYFSFVYTHLSFAYLPVRLYSVLRELHPA